MVEFATRFRQWATARLTEYIRKGFTMDDARLKELGSWGEAAIGKSCWSAYATFVHRKLDT